MGAASRSTGGSPAPGRRIRSTGGGCHRHLRFVLPAFRWNEADSPGGPGAVVGRGREGPAGLPLGSAFSAGERLGTLGAGTLFPRAPASPPYSPLHTHPPP